MPMTITCPQCQQPTQVSGALAGKRVRCPNCRTPFIASVHALKLPTPAKGPRLHIEVKWIILAVLAITIPVGLLLYQSHPAQVAKELAKIQPEAEVNIKGVVERGLQAYMAQQGMFDMSQPHGSAHALDVSFLWSPMYWSMPESVGIIGTTTQGAFGGNYYPKTGQVEVDVEVGGMSLPGAGAVRRGNKRFHLSGHCEEHKVVLAIDGKDAGNR